MLCFRSFLLTTPTSILLPAILFIKTFFLLSGSCRRSCLYMYGADSCMCFFWLFLEKSRSWFRFWDSNGHQGNSPRRSLCIFLIPYLVYLIVFLASLAVSFFCLSQYPLESHQLSVNRWSYTEVAVHWNCHLCLGPSLFLMFDRKPLRNMSVQLSLAWWTLDMTMAPLCVPRSVWGK